MFRYIASTFVLAGLASFLLRAPEGQPGFVSLWADAFKAAHAPTPLPSAEASADPHPDQPRAHFVARWGETATPGTWALPGYSVCVTFTDDDAASSVSYLSTLNPAWSADTLAGALAANGRAWRRNDPAPTLAAAFLRKVGFRSSLDGSFVATDGSTATLRGRYLQITSPAENRRRADVAAAHRAADLNPSNF